MASVRRAGLRGTALALLAVAASGAAAQTGALAGRVVDAETGAPVVGATVLARTAADTLGRAADADGAFAFDALPAGPASLRVRALGYGARDLTATVEAGRTVRVEVALVPETSAVAEVVVQARRSETATRAETPVLLVPQAVSVVSETVLEGQGARDATDALRNVPGASSQSRGQPGAIPVLRGFETDQTGGGVRRNGVEVPYLADGLHANVARVEVLRGPASVLYGRLEPGGVVNFVTAKPRRQPGAQALAEAGTLGSGRLVADATGPLSARLAGRAVGEVEREGSGRDGVSTASAFVAPSLRWERPGLRLDAEAEATLHDAVIDPGLVALGEPTPATLDAVPRDRFFGEPTARHRWAGLGAYAAAEGSASPAVDVRAAASLSRHRLRRDVVEAGRLAEPGVVGRTLQRDDLGFTYLKGSAFADARARTGAVRHALTVGAEALRAWAQADVRVPVASGPGGLTVGVVPPVSLDAPAPTGLDTDDLDAVDASVGGLDLGAFVQDRATLRLGRGALHVVGSARLTHVRYRVGVVALADTPVAPAGLSERTGSVTAVTPAGGVVVEVRPGLALYVSGGTSFNPVVERVGRDGQPFRPTRGVQVEGGVKVETARVAASASAFWIRKDDALTVGAGGFADQTGRQRSRGVEAEARGEPAPGLVVLASGALLDAVVTADDNVAPGTRLPYAPRWSASGWAEWTRGACRAARRRVGPGRAARPAGGRAYAAGRGDRRPGRRARARPRPSRRGWTPATCSTRAATPPA